MGGAGGCHTVSGDTAVHPFICLTKVSGVLSAADPCSVLISDFVDLEFHLASCVLLHSKGLRLHSLIA